MNSEFYVNSDSDVQNKILIIMSNNCLYILKKYKKVYDISNKSLRLIKKYMIDQSISADEVSIYLNHPNSDYDGLAVQFDFVENDPMAIAALDIICYATGAVSRSAFLSQGVKYMPDPVSMATPDVTVDALNKYKLLLDHGLVPSLDIN